METDELIQFLESEKTKVTADVERIGNLFQTLSESLATLVIPFRDIFGADLAKTIEPEGEPAAIHIGTHKLQSAEGQIHDNIVWLRQIVANIRVVLRHLRHVNSLDLPKLLDIEKINADIREFLERLYALRRTAAAQNNRSPMPQLAQKKRQDIEGILTAQLDPYVRRLIQITKDSHFLSLRSALVEDRENLASFRGSQKEMDLFIRSKCEDLNVPFDPEIIETTSRHLDEDNESLFASLQERYKEPPESVETKDSRIRDDLIKVASRYFARSSELSKLAPILKNAHALFQPRPSLLTRLSMFLARLFGKTVQLLTVDVEYSYITGVKKIERRQASLESLMSRGNELEKLLLRGANRLSNLSAQKQLNSYPVDDLRALIQDTRTNLQQVYEDCFGLVQWLGRSQNESQLQAMPETLQSDLNSLLYTINATLIINSERLTEISTRYGIEIQPVGPKSL